MAVLPEPTSPTMAQLNIAESDGSEIVNMDRGVLLLAMIEKFDGGDRWASKAVRPRSCPIEAKARHELRQMLNRFFDSAGFLC